MGCLKCMIRPAMSITMIDDGLRNDSDARAPPPPFLIHAVVIVVLEEGEDAHAPIALSRCCCFEICSFASYPVFLYIFWILVSSWRGVIRVTLVQLSHNTNIIITLSIWLWRKVCACTQNNISTHSIQINWNKNVLNVAFNHFILSNKCTHSNVLFF